MPNDTLPGAAFMRALAEMIGAILPKGWGFALIVFPFERPGISNYISNAQRPESKQDFNTPEEN